MAPILFNLAIGVALIVLALTPGNSWSVIDAVMGGSFVGFALCLWATRRNRH